MTTYLLIHLKLSVLALALFWLLRQAPSALAVPGGAGRSVGRGSALERHSTHKA